MSDPCALSYTGDQPEAKGLLCSLPKGHHGKVHVAMGTNSEVYLVWGLRDGNRPVLFYYWTGAPAEGRRWEELQQLISQLLDVEVAE